MKEQIWWPEIRDLIEPFTGPVLSASRVDEGFNSQIAVIVNGRYFVKGIRQDHPWVRTQVRERDINPYVRHMSPRLEWSAESGDWILLGFEYVVGRSADYTTDSTDLVMIAEMITRLPEAPTGIDLQLAERRWAAYSDRATLFAGTHLSHTDWSPSNVLIAETAKLVDWAWPTRGAAWIDPACWTVWLIAFGHSPAEAENRASFVPAFMRAPEEAVTEFARAQWAMWTDIGGKAPHSGLAAAARDWHRYRLDR
jgi:hypothetical protein